ncbi:MAG: DegT/DnrJ/EryC1/StrS family aminotransferase [Planctomycetota bacterium]
MNVPLIDLNRAYDPISDEVQSAMQEVCRTQQFVLGPDVEEFEENFSDYVGCTHGIGCASGTDALILSLEALNIGEGDEVITTPFSFFATASSIVRVDATPVFADIDPRTFNLDPAQVEEAVTERTKAIMPVHLYGQCAAMEELRMVADRHDLAIVSDAAQAAGATHSGQQAGSMADAAAFSFYPTKNLGGLGDGGMVTVHSDELAGRLHSLRIHGAKQGSYYHEEVGLNSRLDSLQAAALNAKLPHLEDWLEQRRQNAALYDELLDHPSIETPHCEPENEHTYHQYTIRVESDRDGVREKLDERGVDSAVFYPLPLSLQPCFRDVGYEKGDLPVSEQAAREVISLPIFPGLTEEEIQHVARSVVDAVEAAESTV